MRRRTATMLLAAIVLSASISQSPSAAVDDPWGTYTPSIGGQIAYDHGEFVYQDWVYDDAGARTNVPTSGQQRQHGALSKPQGSFRYPTDAARYGANAADLLEVRMRIRGDALEIRTALNTLLQPDTTVVGVVFSTPESENLVAWPFEAGVSTPAGVALTLWGTDGAVTDMTTQTTTQITQAGGRVAVDTDENTIEAAVPLESLPAQGGVVRVHLATGLWDGDSWTAVPASRSPTTPGGGTPDVPRLWNVAFRDEPVVATRRSQSWFEDNQAQALANKNIGGFHAEIDLGKLASGATEHPPLPRGETVEAIHRSSATIDPGEGVSETGVPGRGESDYQGTNYFNYLGRHQPYALYVPESPHEPAPLAIVLHGGSGNHMSVVNQDGAHADMAEASGRVLASPMCRGPNCQYADYGELDVLEVLEDVERRVSIDADRVTLAGYSMGGYGTYRVGARHPDLFSSVVIWAGRTGRPTDGNGDPHQVLDNFRNVPVMLLHGMLDELEPWPTTPIPVEQRLDELGYEHVLRSHPVAEHLTYGILDAWEQAAAWMDGHARASNPRHVVFKRSAAWDGPLAQLRADDAYWVSDVVQRDGADQTLTFASVDATARNVVGADARQVGYIEVGVDGIGPFLDIGRRAPNDTSQPERVLDLQLTNVASLRIDVGRAALGGSEPFCLRLSTDGAVGVRLHNASPLTRVPGPGCDQGVATVIAQSDGATVRVDGAGLFEILLSAD